MTEEFRRHLSRCEGAMQAAKPIIGEHKFDTDPRTLTVIGFISVLVEHQEAILLLLMHDSPGSASALARPVVEGGFRALWINLPASDAEVQRFNEKDKVDVEFGDIAVELDRAYQTGDLFKNFKTQAWTQLNSYTHGGMQQIGRRFVKNELANNYSEKELYQMTTAVTTIVLLVISCFLKVHGHTDSGDKIQALLGAFGLTCEETNDR